MASNPPLFTLPIASNGSITCTEPQPKVYLVVFQSPPDNRMTPDFCKSLLLALDIIDYRLPKGVCVTTSALPKFYSNGLDLEVAARAKGFFENSLYPLWRRLLTYPMPTIALINGHAFAAGFMIAMMHDYRIMNPHKGYLCLNELDIGAALKAPMASIFRQKVPRADTFRTMILESKRFNALEAIKEGIVDGVGSWDNTVAFVHEMKLLGRAETGVYGMLKEEMWRETVGYLERGTETEDAEVERKTRADSAREQRAKGVVEEWEARIGRTKL